MTKDINFRVTAVGLLCAVLVNAIGPMTVAQAGEFFLPKPGQLISLSSSFNPPILKGIKVHPDNPFRFDFILDRGDESNRHSEQDEGSLGTLRSFGKRPQDDKRLKEESARLIKYFLASITIPEQDLWVNLSPYEKNRIIPNSFGQTEMGRDLLAEDYMLKQITASLIYPEGETGKKFWKRVYAQAAKEFGTTNIPVNTFNKVWIVPEKAVVYENVKAGTAYVVEAKLKVMLEEDYLAMQKQLPLTSSLHKRGGNQKDISPLYFKEGIKGSSINLLGSQIVKEIIIPQLTKEVNEGQNFAQLRQVYNSLILATWYKKKIKDSILAQVYEDENKVKGIEYQKSIIVGARFIAPESNLINRQTGSINRTPTVNDTELIYQRYLQAFRQGAYSLIKEEQDPMTHQNIPRKYFSGGVELNDQAMRVAMTFTQELPINVLNHAFLDEEVVINQVPADRAMRVDEKELFGLGEFFTFLFNYMNQNSLEITSFLFQNDAFDPWLKETNFLDSLEATISWESENEEQFYIPFVRLRIGQIKNFSELDLSKFIKHKCWDSLIGLANEATKHHWITLEELENVMDLLVKNGQWDHIPELVGVAIDHKMILSKLFVDRWMHKAKQEGGYGLSIRMMQYFSKQEGVLSDEDLFKFLDEIPQAILHEWEEEGLFFYGAYQSILNDLIERKALNIFSKEEKHAGYLKYIKNTDAVVLLLEEKQITSVAQLDTWCSYWRGRPDIIALAVRQGVLNEKGTREILEKNLYGKYHFYEAQQVFKAGFEKGFLKEKDFWEVLAMVKEFHASMLKETNVSWYSQYTLLGIELGIIKNEDQLQPLVEQLAKWKKPETLDRLIKSLLEMDFLISNEKFMSWMRLVLGYDDDQQNMEDTIAEALSKKIINFQQAQELMGMAKSLKYHVEDGELIARELLQRQFLDRDLYDKGLEQRRVNPELNDFFRVMMGHHYFKFEAGYIKEILEHSRTLGIPVSVAVRLESLVSEGVFDPSESQGIIDEVKVIINKVKEVNQASLRPDQRIDLTVFENLVAPALINLKAVSPHLGKHLINNLLYQRSYLPLFQDTLSSLVSLSAKDIRVLRSFYQRTGKRFLNQPNTLLMVIGYLKAFQAVGYEEGFDRAIDEITLYPDQKAEEVFGSRFMEKFSQSFGLSIDREYLKDSAKNWNLMYLGQLVAAKQQWGLEFRSLFTLLIKANLEHKTESLLSPWAYSDSTAEDFKDYLGQDANEEDPVELVKKSRRHNLFTLKEIERLGLNVYSWMFPTRFMPELAISKENQQRRPFDILREFRAILKEFESNLTQDLGWNKEWEQLNRSIGSWGRLSEDPGSHIIKSDSQKKLLSKLHAFVTRNFSDRRIKRDVWVKLERLLSEIRDFNTQKVTAERNYTIGFWSRNVGWDTFLGNYAGSCTSVGNNATAIFEFLLDIGTHYVVVKENGKIRGYARIWLAQGIDQKPKIFIDSVDGLPAVQHFGEIRSYIESFALKLGLNKEDVIEYDASKIKAKIGGVLTEHYFHHSLLKMEPDEKVFEDESLDAWQPKNGWQDKAMVTMEEATEKFYKFFDENGEKPWIELIKLVIIKRTIRRDNSDLEAVDIIPGVKVFRKTRARHGGDSLHDIWFDMKGIRKLALERRSSVVPLFVPQEGRYYYELDLRSFGYKTLDFILKRKSKLWLTERRRLQIKDAVINALQPEKGQWFDHHHLHDENLLLLLDKEGNIIDVRIIDFKSLQMLSERPIDGIIKGNFNWEKVGSTENDLAQLSDADGAEILKWINKTFGSAENMFKAIIGQKKKYYYAEGGGCYVYRIPHSSYLLRIPQVYVWNPSNFSLQEQIMDYPSVLIGLSNVSLPLIRWKMNAPAAPTIEGDSEIFLIPELKGQHITPHVEQKVDLPDDAYFEQMFCRMADLPEEKFQDLAKTIRLLNLNGWSWEGGITNVLLNWESKDFELIDLLKKSEDRNLFKLMFSILWDDFESFYQTPSLFKEKKAFIASNLKKIIWKILGTLNEMKEKLTQEDINELEEYLVKDGIFTVNEKSAFMQALQRDFPYLFSHGARILTRISDEQLALAKALSGKRTKQTRSGNTIKINQRVYETADGRLEIKDADEGNVITRSSFAIVNKRLMVLDHIISLAHTLAQEGKNLVLLDWGAGTGKTLLTLKNELEGRGITNVEYYGLSDEYFPEWENLPSDIHMIFDTEQGLPNHFKTVDGKIKQVDLIVSYYGLNNMIKKRSKKYPQYSNGSYFSILKSLLSPYGEIRTISGSMPIGQIEALDFRAEKIPVPDEVWNSAEKQDRMTAWRFTVHKAPDGSPAEMLDNIRNNADLIRKLFNEGASFEDLAVNRRRSDGGLYSRRTIQKELEMLKKIGLLDRVGKLYYFSGLAQVLRVPYEKYHQDVVNQLVERVNAIDYKDDKRMMGIYAGDTRPLHRYEIPEQMVYDVGYDVERIIRGIQLSSDAAIKIKIPGHSPMNLFREKLDWDHPAVGFLTNYFQETGFKAEDFEEAGVYQRSIRVFRHKVSGLRVVRYPNYREVKKDVKAFGKLKFLVTTPLFVDPRDDKNYYGVDLTQWGYQTADFYAKGKELFDWPDHMKENILRSINDSFSNGKTSKRSSEYVGWDFHGRNIFIKMDGPSAGHVEDVKVIDYFEGHWRVKKASVMDRLQKGKKNFSKERFYNLDLRGYDFSGVNLKEAIFFDCLLDHAEFQGANLELTEFRDCDLSHADFTDAVLKGAKIYLSKLVHSKFKEAVVSGMKVFESGLYLEIKGLLADVKDKNARVLIQENWDDLLYLVNYINGHKNRTVSYEKISIGTGISVEMLKMFFKAISKKGIVALLGDDVVRIDRNIQDQRDVRGIARRLGILRIRDKAMINGGIDLSSTHEGIQIQNSGISIKFHLDPSMLYQLQNAAGFVPVIISVQPIKDLRLFLTAEV